MGFIMDDYQLFNQRALEHQFLVRRIIARYIHNRETVFDLTQQALLYAWRARNDFKNESKYSTWICRIAINVTLNYLLAQKRNPLYRGIDITIIDETKLSERAICQSAEDILIQDEAFNKLSDAVKDLPEIIRGALVLHSIYALSYQQVADLLDIPIGTVRSRIHRAREILRSRLDNHC